MTVSYIEPGLALRQGDSGPKVLALQTDLRRLGYLGGSLDAAFGEGTARAIRALQTDLLGLGTKLSGTTPPPFAIASFNTGNPPLVSAVTGLLDQNLAAYMTALLADPRAGWVPRSDDPAGQNKIAHDALVNAHSTTAPWPFLLAMAQQESGVRHFQVPYNGNVDDFVTIGLDRNDKAFPDRITSRGYGLGQYTIFHHPATPAEIDAYVLDPARNVLAAFAELRQDFDARIAGPSSRADDRDAEFPKLATRLCRYPPANHRYLVDCRACARGAPTVDIHRGTPFYQGASGSYQPDQYYPSAEYPSVPDRIAFGCDWPYAARRYNGGGNDSYHYQCIILRNVAALPAGS